MCPSVAYAAPFDVNATSSTSPLTSLPDNITSILTSSLQSFSTSLLSQACGRDYYSHVSTCADCYAAYRDWLCRVLVPRCADAVSSTTADPPAATVSRTAANPRDPGIYTPSYDYVELLQRIGLVPRVCNSDVPSAELPPIRATALWGTMRTAVTARKTRDGRRRTSGAIGGAMGRGVLGDTRSGFCFWVVAASAYAYLLRT
jgi:hypothetical protein